MVPSLGAGAAAGLLFAHQHRQQQQQQQQQIGGSVSDQTTALGADVQRRLLLNTVETEIAGQSGDADDHGTVPQTTNADVSPTTEEDNLTIATSPSSLSDPEHQLEQRHSNQHSVMV